jgi:hypothetical protein
MRTCSTCGDELVPSSRRIRVFSSMEDVRQLRVEADECPACGQTVPAEGAVEKALCAGASIAPAAFQTLS